MTLEEDTINARATFSKQNTATKTSLCLGVMYFQPCGIYIWSACVKNFECLLLNLMKPETLSTCSFLFTLLSDDGASIDDDH